MGKVSQIMFLYVKKKISGCANAMRQYSKQEKIILKNSLSLDTDDFRSKGWMSVEITVSSLSVNYHEFTCGQKVVRCVSMA